jgi:hypothetical protein
MSNESLNTNEGERNMKQYEVVISESLAKWIKVEATSEEEAIQKVQQGYWSEDDVVKEDRLDSSVEGAEEVVE